MADDEKSPYPPTVTARDDDGLHRQPDDNAWVRFMTWIRWYPADMPAWEKSLVLKLDLMILIYGCLCFFTKYLSQASLTNAYVT